MNCSCITELEAQVNKWEFKGKNVANAQLVDKSISFHKGKLRHLTFSTFEFEVEGLKNKKKMPFLHEFCPFCGTKIDTEADKSTVETPV